MQNLVAVYHIVWARMLDVPNFRRRWLTVVLGQKEYERNGDLPENWVPRGTQGYRN